MIINKKIIDHSYQITFGNLDVSEFMSLNWQDRNLLIDTIFKSRAHFLIYKLFHKYDESYKNYAFYKKAKNIVNFYTYQSMIHLEESYRLNTILNNNNINFIFLKGVHLLHIYYDDIIERPIRDIDILVKKQDVKRVVDILLKNGFRFEYDVDEISIDYFLTNSYDIPALIGRNGSRLEIHFAIENLSHKKNCVFAARFFQDSKKIKYGNDYAQFLSDEDLILHLIYHGLKKQGPDVGIIFISDLYKVLLTNKYSRTLLVDKAREYNLLPHLKIIMTILSSKSNKKTFNDLNNMIHFNVDNNIINSLEHLFVRNDLSNEEIKLFQFFRNLRLKKIVDFYRVESIVKEKKLNKNEIIRLWISYILKVLNHIKIIFALCFRLLLFRSIRLQFFKIKSILVYINDF